MSSALVLEGGTFRPIFSCGVMDALLDYGVEFPYVIGVSAGIADGVSYVSKQKKRNYDILVNHRHDSRYIGIRNLFSDKSMFGIRFIYEQIPKELYPFDWETYKNSTTKVRVGVTNARTGEAEYLDGHLLDEKSMMLKATCALPLVFPPIEVDGEVYYDGGLADSIPAKKAVEDGNKKLLIILTRPKGYQKELSKANVVAARVLKKRYPQMVKLLLDRHERYNRQLAYCEQLEKEGKALILRPDQETQIGSFEKDIDKIKLAYSSGYKMAVANMEQIKGLL